MKTDINRRAMKVIAGGIAVRALAEKDKGARAVSEFLTKAIDEITLEIAREVAKVLGYEDNP